MSDQSNQVGGSFGKFIDVNKPVYNIGSHPDNDMVLSGKGILPFHAMIVSKSGNHTLIPLTPLGEVMVAGNPIHQEATPLENDQLIVIGTSSLKTRITPDKPGLGLQILSSPPAFEAGSAPNSQTPMDINVILANGITHLGDVQVNQTARYEIEVINAGPIVANFTVLVNDIPSDWVEIEPRSFNLNEGRRATVQISITPPREPGSTAGVHPFKVIIASQNYPGLHTEVPLQLTIEPYYEFTLGNLVPKQQNISYTKKFGLVKLPITNLGNGDTEFSTLALDDENGCTFDFLVRDDLQLSRQATFVVAAGSTYTLPITITPHKRPIFSMQSKRYQYTTTVQVVPLASSQQVVSGSATNYPLFGWWSIVLGVLALLFAVFLLVQPRISRFEVASGKDVIELGDTTKLEWAVSPFATRLNLSNSTEVISYGQTSLTIAPTQSTNYELTAGNWLSGILGLDQKQNLSVLVVPPQPSVNVFEVDNTEVPRGKPVKVRWSVTQADKAILTMGGVVYELTPDKFSGEQSVILDKDSLVTMEAINASGSELRSYFINVVDPYITIKTFTVWVRPIAKTTTIPEEQLMAMIQDQSPQNFSRVPHLARPASDNYIIAPRPPKVDDSFIEKYVALVADRSSDIGYRVEFYQPDRELAKGEQVMIEWNVLGTNSDTVQIAPFTDILPNTGRQPFFPQESMNFVLTAQSGEEQKLFMLPVVVFDGIPPAAPKIEIFKASPLSMVGPGKTQFAWSVAGEWTRIQLASGKGIIADNMNPQGFKSVSVNKSDTFILTAWNGSLSSSQALDITINPALIAPGLSITAVQPTTGRFMVGGKITVTVAFTTIPTGKPNPTGQVTVTDGNAICSIPLPASSCDLIFKTSGTKSITASFPGDTIYQQSNAPAFAQSIIVASAQVDLIPTFFFKGGTTPIAVESTDFDIDKGMDVIVEVRPKNTILADNNGNITVSLCEQDALGQNMIATCTFVGSAQVKVAAADTSTETAGNGYAKITIQNFTRSGKLGMLFEYTHASNAIDPASTFQPNINIRRAKIILSLPYCDNPFAFSNCSYGLSSSVPPVIIFDLNIPGQVDPILLSSLLPSPASTAFTVTSSPTATWTCSVIPVSGTYKLSCAVVGLVAGSTYTVNFSFNNADPLPGIIRNDYFMGSDPATPTFTTSFSLRVLTSTKTVIGNLGGVRVGDRIYLTGDVAGGLISVLTGAGTPLSTTGSLTLEEKSGADVFGIENEGLNCSKDPANPAKIIISAANAKCYIYFTHVGNYTLVASFTGDDNNNGSTSGDSQVTVQKQNLITADFKYFDITTGYYLTFPTSWDKNKDLPVRIILDGPSSAFSPPDTSFPPTALIDRKLLITLGTWATTNCAITTDSNVTLVSPGIYEVKIAQKATADPVNPASNIYVTSADFTIRCTLTDSLGLSFTVDFSDKTTPKKDSDDFAFTSAIAKSNIRITEPDLGNMNVRITRQDTATTAMLSSTTDTSLDKLHFGQKYDVSITDSSRVTVPYTYYVDVTYTYTYWWYGTYIGSSSSTSGDAATRASNERTAIWNTYNSNSKWSFDPSNFLSLQANLAKTTASTCGNNMAMTVTSKAWTSSDPSSWALTYWNNYYSGLYWISVRTYRVTYYGSTNFKLLSSSSCMFALDSTTATNTAITSTSGTIAINAKSANTNPLFNVTNTFSVDGIDKQQVKPISFSPTSPAAVFLNTNLPITASLSSNDVTGGTSLPFVDTGLDFSQQFAPSPSAYTGTCAGLSRTDTLNSTGVVQTFRSTAAISSTSSCGIGLRYLGNRYFKEVGPNSLPAMTFLEPGGVSLSISPSSPSPYGTTLTLTATTSPGSMGGSVTFKDGTTVLGSQTVTTGATTGSASITTATLSIAGSPHSLTAVFTPTDTLNYSAVTSPAQPYTITAATTTTALGVSPASPQAFATSIALSATITPVGQAGNVVFRDGSTVIGNANVSTTTGIATINVSNLNVATSPHALTAVFTPTNTNFSPSTSAAQNFTTTTATSTTALAQSAASTMYGNSVTFTATVPTLATGSVTFKDGATTISTVAIVSGSAAYTTSTLDVVSSPHSITAVFTPDNTNYSTSTSAAVSHVITAATTTTAEVVLTSPTPPIQNTQNITFTVTVTSGSAAIPLGSVEFFKNGTTSLGTVTVSSGTNTSLNYVLNNVKLTPAGTYTITAVYTPATSNLLGSTSPTSLSVTTQ